jgi:hypothetical protein
MTPAAHEHNRALRPKSWQCRASVPRLPGQLHGRKRWLCLPELPECSCSGGLACYAQLWLPRGLAADLRLPWQRPALPGRLTPARVRRGFRAIHGTLPVLTAAPKPGKPGPGRPPGSKNRHPATRHDVGKARARPPSRRRHRKPRRAREVKRQAKARAGRLAVPTHFLKLGHICEETPYFAFGACYTSGGGSGRWHCAPAAPG